MVEAQRLVGFYDISENEVPNEPERYAHEHRYIVSVHGCLAGPSVRFAQLCVYETNVY